MAFLTDRKRAVGWGAAKTGTEHAWAMKKSAVALIVIVPLFVFTFGAVLGGTYEEIVAYYSRPFPAIIAALMIVVGFKHFNDGIRSTIEDYTHEPVRNILILLVMILSYGSMAVGLFSIAKLAL